MGKIRLPLTLYSNQEFCQTEGKIYCHDNLHLGKPQEGDFLSQPIKKKVICLCNLNRCNGRHLIENQKIVLSIHSFCVHTHK